MSQQAYLDSLRQRGRPHNTVAKDKPSTTSQLVHLDARLMETFPSFPQHHCVNNCVVVVPDSHMVPEPVPLTEWATLKEGTGESIVIVNTVVCDDCIEGVHGHNHARTRRFPVHNLGSSAGMDSENTGESDGPGEIGIGVAEDKGEAEFVEVVAVTGAAGDVIEAESGDGHATAHNDGNPNGLATKERGTQGGSSESKAEVFDESDKLAAAGRAAGDAAITDEGVNGRKSKPVLDQDQGDIARHMTTDKNT